MSEAPHCAFLCIRTCVSAGKVLYYLKGCFRIMLRIDEDFEQLSKYVEQIDFGLFIVGIIFAIQIV